MTTKPSTAIRFNTHRGYSAEGQIIIAWKHTPDVIRFHDQTRGIKGEINTGLLHQREIMQAYDAGQYSGVWFDNELAEQMLAND
jgi:hypothetical protein